MPNLLDCPKTAVLLGFRAYFPSTLDIKQTVSTWPETTIALTQNLDRSLIGGQELVHDFARSLIGTREHLPVRGNRSRSGPSDLFVIPLTCPGALTASFCLAYMPLWLS